MKQIYSRGMKAYAPKPGAPSYAVSNIGLNVENFAAFAEKYKKADGSLHLEIKVNDRGEHIVVLSKYHHKDQILQEESTSFDDTGWIPAN